MSKLLKPVLLAKIDNIPRFSETLANNLLTINAWFWFPLPYFQSVLLLFASGVFSSLCYFFFAFTVILHTHLFPMNPFSTPWKRQKTLQILVSVASYQKLVTNCSVFYPSAFIYYHFPPKDSVSGVFQEVEKGCIGSKWVNSWLSKLQLRKQSHYFGSTQLHATLQLWNYSYFFIEIICSPVDRRAILQVCPACWYLKFSLSKPDTWWISCSSLVVFKRSRKGNPECEILLHSEYLKNR